MGSSHHQPVIFRGPWQTERIAEWRKSERRISAKDARAACHRCSAVAAMESAVAFSGYTEWVSSGST